MVIVAALPPCTGQCHLVHVAGVLIFTDDPAVLLLSWRRTAGISSAARVGDGEVDRQHHQGFGWAEVVDRKHPEPVGGGQLTAVSGTSVTCDFLAVHNLLSFGQGGTGDRSVPAVRQRMRGTAVSILSAHCRQA